jgi:hypothetical protein
MHAEVMNQHKVYTFLNTPTNKHMQPRVYTIFPYFISWQGIKISLKYYYRVLNYEYPKETNP